MITPVLVTDLEIEGMAQTWMSGLGGKIAVGHKSMGLEQQCVRKLYDKIIADGGEVSQSANLYRRAHGKPIREKRASADWSEEHQQLFFVLLAPYHQAYPADAFVTNCKRAMSDMPPYLRQPVRPEFVASIAELFAGYNQRYDTLEKENVLLTDKLQKALAKPGREEILAAVSDDEVVDRFGRQVLDNILPSDIVIQMDPMLLLSCMEDDVVVSYYHRMMYANQQEHSTDLRQLLETMSRVLAHMPSEKARVETLKKAGYVPLPPAKVALVGWKGDQELVIKSKFDEKRCKFSSYKEVKHPECGGNDIIVHHINCSHTRLNYVKSVRRFGTGYIATKGIKTAISKLFDALAEMGR